HKKYIKLYFYELYLESKRNANKILREEVGSEISADEYNEILSYCDLEKVNLIINEFKQLGKSDTKENDWKTELCYYLRDKNNTNITFIKFKENLKFSISSKYLKHPFELFYIKNIDFFNCISRFHLPCVRSYYNGG